MAFILRREHSTEEGGYPQDQGLRQHSASARQINSQLAESEIRLQVKPAVSHQSTPDTPQPWLRLPHRASKTNRGDPPLSDGLLQHPPAITSAAGPSASTRAPFARFCATARTNSPISPISCSTSARQAGQGSWYRSILEKNGRALFPGEPNDPVLL
jgi:hypothetical protein